MKGFFDRVYKHGCLLHYFSYRLELLTQAAKFPRYQVFMRYDWPSAGMTKGNRLWKQKRKRNVLRRDDYFYFHRYSFLICITDQAWGQHDWICGQIPFPGWLCHETSSFARSLRDLVYWSSLRLIFKLMRGRLVASLAFCLPRRSWGQWKKNDANIQLSWPKKLGQYRIYFMAKLSWFWFTTLSCCF